MRPDTIGSAWRTVDWSCFFGIVAVSVLVRWVFFTGVFGSDDVVYAAVARDLARGIWTPSDYIGSLRYGFTLPVAAFIRLFGPGEAAATAWVVLCSVGEVALVFTFARWAWDLKAAVLSGLALALLPMHVNRAGMLLADAPLAFFITLSFVLFYLAERRQQARWYVAAGLAGGCVYWIKEVVAIYLVIFAIYALLDRFWNLKRLWMVVGVAVLVVANSLLFWTVTGDPLKLFRVITRATSNYISIYTVETSPWFYFRYMFLDARHTWLVPYLALGGLAIWLYRRRDMHWFEPGTTYVAVWALGLLGVFSFAVLSLDPLTLIAKQTNYMLIFMAPLALLAGYFLAQLPRPAMVVGAVVMATGSIALAGLEQQAIRTFTANSKAAIAFASRAGDTPVYGLSNAVSVALYAAIMQRREMSESSIRPVKELISGTVRTATGSTSGNRYAAYVVFDQETSDWGTHPLRQLAAIPSCWEKLDRLDPLDLGFGPKAAELLNAAVSQLPGTIGSAVASRLGPVLVPKPAYVFGVPATCTS